MAHRFADQYRRLPCIHSCVVSSNKEFRERDVLLCQHICNFAFFAIIWEVFYFHLAKIESCDDMPDVEACSIGNETRFIVDGIFLDERGLYPPFFLFLFPFLLLPLGDFSFTLFPFYHPFHFCVHFLFVYSSD